MIATRSISIFLSTTFLLVLGQAPKDKDATDPTRAPAKTEPMDEHARFVTVHLKFARCTEALRVIAPMIRPLTATADERTNCIVMSGSDQNLDRAQQILRSLDSPSGEELAPDEVAIIPLRYRNASEIAEHLGRTISSRHDVHVRIAADSGRNSLIIDAPRAFVERAQNIVKALDTPEQSARLEFAMLHASTNAGKEGEDELADLTSEIPSDLTDVAKELARFGKVRLIGRLSTTATEAQRFDVEGSVANQYNLHVSGRLADVSIGGAARLEVEATMSRHAPTFGRATSQPSRELIPMFKLHTSLTGQRGDTLVLGTAPTGWRPGDSAILVVRIGK